MSSRTADRVIALEKELGPLYRAIAAVAQLWAEAESAAPAPAHGVEKRIAELEERGPKLAASFRQVAASADGVERGRLIRTIREMEQNLERVELELR